MTGETSAIAWQAGVGTVLMLLLAVAVASDLRLRRIPNVLVLVTLFAGLLFHAFGPASPVAGAAGGLFSTEPGALGGWRALGGAVTGFALFLPLYLLKLLGAGDVKLLTGVGSFAGAEAFVNLALFVLLCGGLLALMRMAWAQNTRLVLRNALAALGQWLPGTTADWDAATQTAWRMPYAVAVVSGVVTYGAWTLSGREPLLAL